MTRTEHSMRNLRFALIFQTLALITAFFTRHVFVSVLSQEYLGLDGTFANILVTLSLAELGLGDAILFSLYKPLAENDTAKLSALMDFYRKSYHVIGCSVAGLGFALSPFLPHLIHDFPDLPHVYLIYFLFVTNSALSYFFVYKQSLIMADQRRYLVTAWRYGLWTVLYLLQALFLWITHQYLIYLCLQLVETLAENWILAHKADKLYPFLRDQAEPLDQETKQTVIRNTRAMFLHKLGGAVVFNTDNLLISYFIGVVSVGLYSNYLLVIKGLRNVYKMIFAAFSGSVGNLGATADKTVALRVYHRMNFAGSWMMGWFSICLMVLFNPFLSLWVGENYLFPLDVVLLIVLNFYITGMREVNLTFQNGYGLFRRMRYKSIFEAIINLGVSIILVKPLGITGIFIGTFASTMLTCFWVEPYLLFRYVFERPLCGYFLQYAGSSLLTIAAGTATWHICSLLPETGLLPFAAKVILCGIVPNWVFLIVLSRFEEFQYFRTLLISRFRSK